MRQLTGPSTANLAAWGKRRDLIVHNTAPFNAEPPATVLAESEITGSDAFYCRNHGAIPDIGAQRWRLRVSGAVTTPLTLSYPELTDGFAAAEVLATLECAGNRRVELTRVRPIPGKEPWRQAAVSTAVWRGARLAEVLYAAGVPAAESREGWHVAFTAPDVAPEARPPQRFGASIPLAKALSEEVLLAWQMNGAALPVLHGGPVRVLVPGFIGARSVKWVSGISVQRFPSRNYFQAVDYRRAGIAMSSLALNCAILDPDDGATVAGGPLDVRGYALAEDCRRIAQVQVSVDEGAVWRTARLRPARSRWAWRHWSLRIDAQLGALRVTARAVDDTGATHPETPAALWNSSGYGNNCWSRVELTVR